MTWHYTITSEMRELGLKGNELLVYAVVYGYFANGQGCYFGSINYLADLCGVSYRTAFDCLKALTSRGLLTKTEEFVGGVKVCRYGVAEFAGGMQNLQGGYAKFADNNKIDSYISPVVDKSTTAPKGGVSPKSSDIKQLFLNDGCASDDLRDWVTARKGAKVTEAVYKGMKREAEKAGITLAEAVRICAENSWRGFRAEYLERKNARKTVTLTGGSTFMGDIQRTYDKLAAGWAERAARVQGGQR